LIDQKQTQQKGRDIPELVAHSQIDQCDENTCWKKIDRKMETREKEPGIRKVNKTPKQIGFYDFDQIGLHFLRIP
jgi:hypothetical protein